MNLDIATILTATGADVFRYIGGGWREGGLAPADLAREIGAETVDSRDVGRGDLFIALPVERVDGHDFVQHALAGGAGACLVSRMPADLAEPPSGGTVASAPLLLVVPDALQALQDLARHWRLMHDAEVIGVTGSIGKTTTPV